MIESVTYGSTVICRSLTKPSATTLERRDQFAEEQPDGDARGEPDEDALGERHSVTGHGSRVTGHGSCAPRDGTPEIILRVDDELEDRPPPDTAGRPARDGA